MCKKIGVIKKLVFVSAICAVFICFIQLTKLNTRKKKTLAINVKIYSQEGKAKESNIESIKSHISLDKKLEKQKNLSSAQISKYRNTATMPFDMEIINLSFSRCFEENLDLEAYNKGYDELYDFFSMLGTVFGFIAADVREKIDILNAFRKDDLNREHYLKTEDMMLYEIRVNKETGNELLGSRTLLRLHRALEFTMLFLERLGAMGHNDKVSNMASTTYSETLAKFHPWLIRNGAKLAMYTLPNREDLLRKVVPEGTLENVVMEKLNVAVKALRSVHMAIEELYTKHDLHGLP